MCSCGCNCGSGEACYIVEPVLDPVIVPESQQFSDVITVTITCATQNAVIHYTIDGTAPTASSPIYTGPITLTETATVKAIALLQYFSPSNIVKKTYTKPVPAGTLYWGYSSDQMLTGIQVLLLDSKYATDPYGTYSFDKYSTVNDYFYFWWPDFFGSVKTSTGFLDLVTLSPIVMADDSQGFNSGTDNGWWYKTVTVNGVIGKLFRSYYQLGGGGVFDIEVLSPTGAIYRADTTYLTADMTTYTADYDY